MAKVPIALIKELREKTGSGMQDCKDALVENDNDVEKAIVWLRKKGIAKAAKKADRVSAEGVIESYIHGGGRIGSLVEVNIETDFAAKNEDFRQFARDIAMQVAATNPRWVNKEDVPEEVVNEERDIAITQAKNAGKPEKIWNNIADGRLNKFYDENCLMLQPYFRDEDKTVHEVIQEMIAQIGENIVIRRFVRFEVGEGIEKKEDDFAAEVAEMAK